MFFAPDEGGGGEGDPDPAEDGGGERLYAGKYKTVEDMENAYKEAQSKIGQSGQTLAHLRAQARAAGGDVDEQGNLVMPQTTTRQAPETGNNFAEQFNAQIFADPHSAISQFIGQSYQQQRATEKAAQANMRRSIAEFKDDPLFSHIREEFEAEMLGIDDNVLANPQQATQAANFIYNSVAGKYARTKAGKAKVDPEERRAFVKSFGVEEPQATNEGHGDSVSAEDEMMLREMGLSDSKVRKEVAESARKTGGGTRDRY